MPLPAKATCSVWLSPPNEPPLWQVEPVLQLEVAQPAPLLWHSETLVAVAAGGSVGVQFGWYAPEVTKYCQLP